MTSVSFAPAWCQAIRCLASSREAEVNKDERTVIVWTECSRVSRVGQQSRHHRGLAMAPGPARVLARKHQRRQRAEGNVVKRLQVTTKNVTETNGDCGTGTGICERVGP
jgi:hypothetical protein